MWSHRPSFSIALTIASRALLLRDRLRGRVPSRRPPAPNLIASDHDIRSGDNLLHAVYVQPADKPVKATVLLCHGIGEVVSQWFPAQQLFAEHGIASLVFDYSGYGRSSGSIHWTQCEEDAIAAFHHLETLAPGRPISLLGFSLGSGIAPAVVNELPVDRLILCAAFTSFPEATHAVGIPRALARLVPPIWNAKETLCACSRPILIVHSEADRLFPVTMAHELASYCPGNANLHLVTGVSHSEPFYFPKMSFWAPVITFLTS
jgi:pimeloyl-ACP methyl ester carboxylesterase